MTDFGRSRTNIISTILFSSVPIQKDSSNIQNEKKNTNNLHKNFNNLEHTKLLSNTITQIF